MNLQPVHISHHILVSNQTKSKSNNYIISIESNTQVKINISKCTIIVSFP